MTTRRPDAPQSMTTQHDDDAPPASGLSSMQRAIMTIQKMRAKIENLERARVEPIAIIGMGCRFPGGANTPEAFFELLKQGVDAITEVPPERWGLAPEQSTDPEARAVRWGAFLRDVDLFDARFFGISPREAAKMDPQQRLLLEVTWEALERAGQVPERLVGSRTGVFLGIMNNDYAEISADAGHEQEDAYTTTGNGHSFPPGRLSYTFGFQGPSVAVDTACSSSLVSIHLACQSLRSGECSMAVAGGVNLMLVPSTTRKYAKTQALSPDGRCKTFDATANGFVRGEGCGMIVLKRLSDAERDGDTILALIRGSAVNQDGRSTGLTTPNVLAQQAMLTQALESARVAPSDVGYVEAHGTGTSLGDPIEMEALTRVFGHPRESGSTCVLGAVKTNIGHLESAAGVAGLIKTVLVLQNGIIPKNNHFRTLNPRIQLDRTPFVIPTEMRTWRVALKRRVAGVSSFGMSGTNAHVVVEDFPPSAEEDLSPEASAYLLPLSAKSPAALRAHAAAVRDYLTNSQGDGSLRDIVYTASLRRAHFEYRLAAVGRTREEIVGALSAFTGGEASSGLAQGRSTPARAKVVFVFSGQGAQWLGMGRKLYEEESAFRSVIESCDALLAPRIGWSILDELDTTEAMSRLNETQVAQPLIFAIQIALVELLRSWGVAPDAVIGHSVGEIAAAHVAGILSLDEAVRLVAIRGRIMNKATGLGKMVAVAVPPEVAREAIAGYEDRVAIAAVNDPGSVVLSGQTLAVDEIVAKLERDGAACRPLRVNYAFHSPQMDALSAELVERLARVSARRATLAMYSTVLGECVDGAELDARYWGRNVRETVDLAEAVGKAIRDGYQLFLEVGPHPVLTENVRQTLAAKKADGFVAYTLRRNHDDRLSLLEAVGGLYTRGCFPEWARIVPSGGRCVPLPTYPWQRERFWVNTSEGARASRGGVDVSMADVHPLLGAAFESSVSPAMYWWQRAVDHESLGDLRHHVVGDVVVFPAAAYVEMAISAAAKLDGAGNVTLEDAVFERALSFGVGERKMLQAALVPEDGGAAAFHVSSRASRDTAWTRNATVRVRVEGQAPGSAGERVEAPHRRRARCATEVSADEHYRVMESLGLSYGPAFRVVEGLWVGSDEVIARLTSPIDENGAGFEYFRRVVLLDGAFQALEALLCHEGKLSGDVAYLPASVERVAVLGPVGRQIWAVARVRSSSQDAVIGDITLVDEEGVVRVAVDGLVLRPVKVAKAAPRDWVDACAFAVEWRPSARPQAPAAKPGSSGGVLVVADRKGVGTALVALLRERGIQAVHVIHGDHYERIGYDAYTVDPENGDDYTSVLRGAFSAQFPCRAAVHLSSIDSAGWAATTTDTLVADQRHGSVSLLHLAQALVRLGGRDTPRLWITTQGAQVASAAGPPPSVAQAALWGMARTIALEHPELDCARVDLDPSGDTLRSAQAILDEILVNGREDQLAFRGEARLAARLARASLSRSSTAPSLRPDASYLITGGLGGLGLSLAQWMVQHGARHFALVGRRGPAEPAMRAIRAMEQAGAKVLVIEADVARAADVGDVFAQLDEHLPPLRGVVHAAAVLADHTLLELSGADVRTVMAPKLLGAFHLHDRVVGRELDFFLLYSSAAALLGSAGQANYGAANAAVDALAQARRAMGLPATSVQWGPFSEVGLAAAARNRGARLAHRGLESLSPEEGHQALLRILASSSAELAIMRFDLRRWLEALPQAAASPFWSELRKERVSGPSATAGQTSVRRTIDGKPEGERRAAVEGHLRTCLARVLQVDAAGIDLAASFTDLGMDSLTSLELRNRLETTLELKLPSTLLFTYANSAALVDYLIGRIAPEPPPPAEPPRTSPTQPSPPMPVDDDDLITAFDASMNSIKDGGLV
ncbi:type I polyketide synthase [Polyangium sp. y55x31]|uniref:type I polyketide synthase n=1 Tax=Polyangium sp. y55x31 TaxID=3042688 RepID=UPI0024827F3B|nr:type I polyketide synthase [Polyangium sp. y55x31]MDI1477097.1 type I polyketide synthase [Polyangium sp. y55x31]